MNYAEIKECDVANGPGVRVSLLSVAVHTTAKNVLTPKHGILIMAGRLQAVQKMK